MLFPDKRSKKVSRIVSGEGVIYLCDYGLLNVEKGVIFIYSGEKHIGVL